MTPPQRSCLVQRIDVVLQHLEGLAGQEANCIAPAPILGFEIRFEAHENVDAWHEL